MSTLLCLNRNLKHMLKKIIITNQLLTKGYKRLHHLRHSHVLVHRMMMEHKSSEDIIQLLSLLTQSKEISAELISA